MQHQQTALSLSILPAQPDRNPGTAITPAAVRDGRVVSRHAANAGCVYAAELGIGTTGVDGRTEGWEEATELQQ